MQPIKVVDEDQENELISQIADGNMSTFSRLQPIECQLSENHCDQYQPGKMLIVSGMVKLRDEKDPKWKEKMSHDRALYIDAYQISTKTFKNQEIVPLSTSQSDGTQIQKLSKDPDLFKTLVNSLCPSIIGNEMVKAGLLLSLFGGLSSVRNGAKFRSDIHVLIVGNS